MTRDSRSSRDNTSEADLNEISVMHDAPLPGQNRTVDEPMDESITPFRLSKDSRRAQDNTSEADLNEISVMHDAPLPGQNPTVDEPMGESISPFRLSKDSRRAQDNTSEADLKEISVMRDAPLPGQNRTVDEPMDESITHFRLRKSFSISEYGSEGTSASASSMASASSRSMSSVSSVSRSTARKSKSKDKNGKKATKKIVKKAATRKQSSKDHLRRAVSNLADSKLKKKDANALGDAQMIGTGSGKCHVCGNTACLEHCLECGRKGCSARSNQIKLTLAKNDGRVVQSQNRSSAAFLSPLCLTKPTTVNPTPEVPTTKEPTIAITAQLLVECFSILEKLRLFPSTQNVVEFLQVNYTVYLDEPELTVEVVKKLKAATRAGLLKS